MIINAQSISYGNGPDVWPVVWHELPKFSKSEKLRNLADKMQSQIDYKLNPGVSRQNPTARRARIAAGMALDGERLVKIQSILNGIAELIDLGQCPNYLNVSNKAQIETLLGRHDYANSDHLRQLGITSLDLWNKAQDYIKQFIVEPDPLQKRIKEIEHGLIGTKIDGFFPTPQDVIELMCSYVDLKDKRVLEPSAGNGLIAEQLRIYTDNLVCCEINYTLRELLELKGFHLVGDDFLQHESQYDAIVMNPPFEKFQDIDHVLHAYALLVKPGGTLVSIMSESVFFNKKSKASDFRQWLESKNAEVIPLGQAFKQKGMHRIRTTGVNSRLVIINC